MDEVQRITTGVMRLVVCDIYKFANIEFDIIFYYMCL